MNTRGMRRALVAFSATRLRATRLVLAVAPPHAALWRGVLHSLGGSSDE